MQSQQKKVKWSRGETADALEERTDTGITQVSVSKLENIIADIYGNISRRPALKVISRDENATGLPVVSWNGVSPSYNEFVQPPQYFVFTVDANTYIIFIKSYLGQGFGGLLIRDNKFVKRVQITNKTGWTTTSEKQISAAQYNNFMVVSGLYLGDVTLRLTDTNDIIVEKFQFSAPWYAPAGTQTKTVSSADIAGLEFNKDGNGFEAFAWTDTSGNSSPYSTIDTGLTGDTQQIAEAIPVGSIVKFPNLGCYMRVEGYQIGGTSIYFVDTIFDGVINAGGTIPSSGSYARCTYNGITEINYLEKYVDGTLIETIQISKNATIWVQNDASVSGYSEWNRGTQSWSDVPSGSLNVLMFGALLTPVAAANEKDTSVTVEYGYISLNEYQPTKFTFSQQRLYAAGFENQDAAQKQIPGYAVGSQIAKYNDFKNDFNTASEAVVIDISTSYQEQIVSMVDYNGLKIFTDSAEYNVANGAPVKQSENGSLSTCEPIVFGSVCLYADKSGQQIRALQYELQNDIFASSSINSMAKEDLIFNTTHMAGYLDKEHVNGRFLYAVQWGYKFENHSYTNPKATHTLAVCNMVPGNQAMIWTRWTTPDIKNQSGHNRHMICGAIEVNNKVWFILACLERVPSIMVNYPAYTLAELDFETQMDIEISANNTDTNYIIIPSTDTHDYYGWVDQNDPNSVVYTENQIVFQGDPIYNKTGTQISTATNSPGGPNIVIGGVGYYAWKAGGTTYYTKDAEPNPTGSTTSPFDTSRRLYNSSGVAYTNCYIGSYVEGTSEIIIYPYPTPVIVVPTWAERVPSESYLQYNLNGTQHQADYDSSKNTTTDYAIIPNATVSVFDGDEYKWDDTLDANGNYTKSLASLTHPRVGFMINAELVSHPIDVGGKTYTDHKRIGKCVAVVRDTEPGAFTVCDKTGYMDNNNKTVNFYGCTGMKNELRYTIKNIQGAKFTIESLTMIIEYATLDS